MVMHAILNWLYHFLGVAGTGPYYGFWSGFGSDITELTIFGFLVQVYRNSRCHVDKCHRRGRYPFEHYKLCRLHHPKVPNEPLTVAHVTQLHVEREDAK